MYIFALFYGLLFVGIGFFMKKYPDTIAGYNTMSARRKKWIDVEGMAAYMKKIMVITGIIIFLLFDILWFLGLKDLANTTLWAIPIAAGIYAMFGVRKFDRYKKK